ncbi:MAG: SBBP repeat-containing protein [Bryobacterales bacterium]|nr:SBBP repeat-containing protein [Bryobacterales bacterium]
MTGRLLFSSLLISGCLAQAQVSVSVASYLGGSRTDTVTATAVDAAGFIYLAGWTDSTDLPMVNAGQPGSGGGVDAFVAKLSADGKSVLYCTYLGGSGDDRAFAIAVDSAGNAYVTGWTTSSNFPVTAAFQSRFMGVKDAFVSKIDSAGLLTYSTYLGGSGYDSGNAIAVDAGGNVYVAGETDSSNFPLRNALQLRPGGVADAFVVKLAADGFTEVYATYLGGYLSDRATAIALDASGSVYVAGSTESPDFPVASAFQAAKRGDGQDGFVAKINAGGTALAYSSFMGGSRGIPESVTAIAVDADGVAYVTGVTGSEDFPVKSAIQPMLKGGLDIFVSKVAANGASLLFSTYLGGSSLDYPTAIALDASGRLWIGGYTASTDLIWLSANQVHGGGVYDGFVMMMDRSGTSGTTWLLGGGGADTVNALAVRGAVVYAGGQTGSTTMARNGPYTRLAGALDGLVSLLAQSYSLTLTIASPTTGATYATSAPAVTLAGTAAASLGIAQVSWSNDRGGSGAASGTTAWTAAGIALQTGTNVISIVMKDTAGNSVTATLSVVYTPPAPGAAMLISPSAGSGMSQVFTATITPPGGFSGISEAALLIQGGSQSSANACQATYLFSTQALYLLNDGATSWLGPVAPGSTTTVKNSQCSLTGTGSSAVTNGSTLTVKYAITFEPFFFGDKKSYLYIKDGWTAVGDWTVPKPVSGTLTAPSSGSGVLQVFTGKFIYPEGFADVFEAPLLVQAGTGSPHSCMVDYWLGTKGLYLLDDAGHTWLGPVAPGSMSILENSQCSLVAAASKFESSGDVLVLTYAVVFKPEFAGNKNTYLYFRERWSQVGTWTVPDANTDAVLTPNAGAGMARKFAGTWNFSTGLNGISDVSMLVQKGASSLNACQVDYNLVNRGLYLLNDSATAWIGPVFPGTGGSVQNSQCVLNGAQSQAAVSATVVNLNLDITFKSTFQGPKNVYLYHRNSWIPVGVWMVTY